MRKRKQEVRENSQKSEEVEGIQREKILRWRKEGRRFENGVGARAMHWQSGSDGPG